LKESDKTKNCTLLFPKIKKKKKRNKVLLTFTDVFQFLESIRTNAAETSNPVDTHLVSVIARVDVFRAFIYIWKHKKKKSSF